MTGMKRLVIAALLGPAALMISAVWRAVPPAGAANSATFRDCSIFVPGFDPDFVQLSGVTVNLQNTLTVSPSQHQLPLEASESADPGDSPGHVTLHATVTSAKVPTQTVSGAATGRVVLSVPLRGSKSGRSYTISWSATFDNGNHPCPSPLTPENTTPHPFVVKVS